jgi:hypothetical protein
MARMSDAAKTFDPFADTTAPRSDAADPTNSTQPPAAFQPPIDGSTLPAVPEPYAAEGTSPTLSGQERADLAACETAINTFRIAFWAAGKALQTIRDADLYRETHTTFEAYVEQRWDMSRPQAYRLIDAWQIAERLSPIGDTKPNLAQVSKLVPVAKQHGQDAAVTVYKTVADASPKVTAAVIEGAVAVLPEDHFDENEAVEQIRAYLEGDLQPAAPAVDPGEQLRQVRTRLQRMIKPEMIRAAGPAAAKELAGELRALADQLEEN